MLQEVVFSREIFAFRFSTVALPSQNISMVTYGLLFICYLMCRYIVFRIFRTSEMVSESMVIIVKFAFSLMLFLTVSFYLVFVVSLRSQR